MDTTKSSAPPRAPTTTEDVERLLSACREALDWFDSFARHAPAEFAIGGEARIRRTLREAVRLASFELRPCTACDGCGLIPVCETPASRPVKIGCQECGGGGQVKVFSYGKPRRNGRGK